MVFNDISFMFSFNVTSDADGVLTPLSGTICGVHVNMSYVLNDVGSSTFILYTSSLVE